MYKMFDTLVQEASDRLLIDTDEMRAIRKVQKRIEKNIKNVNDNLELILNAINDQRQKQDESENQDFKQEKAEREDTEIKKRARKFVQNDQQVAMQNMGKINEVEQRFKEVFNKSYVPKLGGIQGKFQGKPCYQQKNQGAQRKFHYQSYYRNQQGQNGKISQEKSGTKAIKSKRKKGQKLGK